METIKSDLLGEEIQVETLRTATKLRTIESTLLGEPSSQTFKPLPEIKFPTDPLTKNLVFFRPDNLIREDTPLRVDVLTAEDLLKLTEAQPLDVIQKPLNQIGTVGANLAGINAPAADSSVETTTGPEIIKADAQPTFSRNKLVFGLVILLVAGFVLFGGK